MIKILYLVLSLVLTFNTFAQVPDVGSDIGFKFFLDLQSLKDNLTNASVLDKEKDTKEQAIENGITFQFPMPDGTYKTFKLLEAPILSPQLAKQFPDIKTYRAYNVTDNSYGGRITISNQGLNAAIHNEVGEVIIENIEGSNYKSFYEKDLKIPFDCGVDDSFEIKSTKGASLNNFSNGTILKTYRIAIVTTAEFFAANGSTQGSAMAVVTNKVNAMSGIYEKEVGITFTIVATKIYENSGTDGLNPGGPLADEARNKFNALNTSEPGTFADALYDIGHVFHSTGGGVAYVGIVCDDFSKGGGWSGTGGSSNKVLYHEVGHMFSARHSFNSILSGCAGNITTSSAYEPGSGSTIMSYFGLCGLDNLSGSTGNYFHTNSLEQIITFSNTAPTCFSSSASNNIAPVVVANPSGNPIVIPKGTPFILEGSGSDADGEVVYYTWEQFDLGTTRGGANAAENSTDSPIFRSYDPSPEGKTRTFPNMATIASNGGSNLDEALPLVARTLKMRLTGRDFNATAGGTHSDQISITVNSTGPFEVSSHPTSSTIAAGATFPVTWNKNGTEALSANVKISLSIDGGQSFPFVILASTPNDESQSITIPANVPATSMARIKISSVGTANYEWFDINNADLTITSSCSAVASFICPVTSISGNTGDAVFNLGINNFAGSSLPGNSKTFNMPGTGNLGMYVYTDDSKTACHLAWSPNGVFTKIRVSKTGSYTIGSSTQRPGGPSSTVATIYNSASFSCASFVSSNGYASVGWSGSFTVTLNECTDYWIAQYRVFNDETSSTLSFSGPGDIYEVGTMPAGFSYTYAAINNTSQNIDAVSSTANFTSLSGGTFTVKGVMYANAMNPATFVGGSESAAYNSGSCILFSGNSKTLNVIGLPCPPNLTHVSTTNDFSSGTQTFQTSNTTGTGLISATNDITGGNITYDAGKRVELKPGFSAISTLASPTVFKAQIGGCN